VERISSASDSGEVGYSLANVRELLFGCLDAAAPAALLEIGAFRGELTRELLEWAAGRETSVAAIDPTPEPQLVELAERHPELELVRETSHRALGEIPLPDAVIIDGDHNYYTVSEELRLIDERAPATGFPLVMFHDVCWPHARRDTYYDPGRIPEEHRQPLAREATVAPGEPGVADAGIQYEWVAEREGGPRNGVLTAIEDFLSGREDLRLAVVPSFFGFGVLWSPDAPWAGAVAEVIDPWDRNPILERLEANRVAHLVDQRRLTALRERHAQLERRFDALRARHARQAQLLTKMVGSRAFGVAEWLSRLNQRGEPVFSREEVRRALDDDS
jgi:hypothetical protein